MNKFIVFNFKMAPSSSAEAKKIFQIFNKFSSKIKKYKLVAVPPYIFLRGAKEKLGKNCFLGAQNAFWLNRNSVTGEISPKMLKSLKAQYVIVGHSERREYLNETNEIINLKIKACIGNDLIPILCIGEKDRIKGDCSSSFSIKKIIFEQLNYALREVTIKKPSDLIIAYEPAWAIGGNQSEKPEKAQEVINLIRFWLARRFSERIAKNLPVLYGGSVSSQNISSFLGFKAIDGVLIGRASANKTELKKLFKKLTIRLR